MEETSVALEDGVRVVLVTSPDLDSALSMVRRVVQERLAACGNVLPGITSVYRWKGDIHEDPEVMIVLKTTAARISELEGRITELHPYEVPEFLSLSVSEGHDPYLRWLTAEVEKPRTSQ